MHLQNGFLLQNGRYRIEDFISQGGFGCTYRAVHVKLNRPVAIKEFFVESLCNRDDATGCISVGVVSQVSLVKRLRAKFLEEANAISALQHNHIVNVFDVFEENGTSYYVMDFINGSSLAQMVKGNRPLNWGQAVGYIRQIADALAYVHSTGRLHLDIKPGNILVDSAGNAILIDFGVSKQYNAGTASETAMIGMTTGYAPYEQIEGNTAKLCPATDIYSLGATLYKLVSGQTPPNSASIVNGQQLNLPQGLPLTIAGAILRSMTPVIAARPQSMAEFIAILDGRDTGLPKTSQTSVPPTLASIPRPNRISTPPPFSGSFPPARPAVSYSDNTVLSTGPNSIPKVTPQPPQLPAEEKIRLANLDRQRREAAARSDNQVQQKGKSSSLYWFTVILMFCLLISFLFVFISL